MRTIQAEPAARRGIFVTALVCYAGLTGCGGGGESGNVASPSPAPLVPITTENADNVARIATSTIDILLGSDRASRDFITRALLADAHDGELHGIMPIITHELERLSGFNETMSPGHIKAVQPVQENCDNGFITGSWIDSDDDNTYSSGDIFSLNYLSCSMENTVFNGSVSISDFSFIGNPNVSGSTRNFRANVAFDNLQLTARRSNSLLNGEFRFALTSDGIFERGELNASSFSYTDDGKTNHLSNLTFKSTADLSTNQYTVDIAVDINSEGLGTLSIETLTTFHGLTNNDFSAGSMKITGSNSSVTLTVIDVQHVRLDVDINNDTEIEATFNKTWLEL